MTLAGNQPEHSSLLETMLIMVRSKVLLLAGLIVASSTLVSLVVVSNWHSVTYFLRPLWDTPPKPFNMITHYYAQNLSMQELCGLHGWTLKQTPRRVFDAVIFNNEIDLLEIRWRELDPYVTKFLLIESDGSFTGNSKPLFFRDARNKSDRFAFAQHKLGYSAVPKGRSPHPFDNESRQRGFMNLLIQQSGIQPGDLLIMSDTDSGHTIDLLRSCDGPPPILHLQLQNFLYSFDFLVDTGSWRASVHVYGWNKQYGHHRWTDAMLATSGWHCSFCLRTARDIAFKMMSYSHADRVRRAEFLEERRIQGIVCRGGDLYGMLPEEYSYRELIHKMGDVPRSFSAIHLPAFLLRNAHRFKFLLPGNCIR
ncbi:beta-1,4-mannosyl-glycoprotein 4-beta-N-acetylglucosaminyltransferase-like [Selaginella moellendorffii]|uniref:beta-1,4-mannosyl-glycoprotein 4-beta-N-acetylglucosaminyltransferase-like n=1 Tax=Selaginella moellendorffii TaxID=88036 RepID=UPI000D1CD19B|nr:beta-1,4-mannosyl-glycoprotein 4-beta-N-acetylglucosaminyltransferase-like [Selaginella moellendorffii]|eukprot:XP_024522047.1 beta-1,4-mannosyl-glycoprotein 4-beta-N-acetylglucosaminyltransferase-like [Selaginella moellendorffii]